MAEEKRDNDGFLIPSLPIDGQTAPIAKKTKGK
jgi:hypothetical protein